MSLVGACPGDCAAREYQRRRVEHWDGLSRTAAHRPFWTRGYHERLAAVYRLLVPPGKRILEIGCGRGYFLATLLPAHGVGIDFSTEMLDDAAVIRTCISTRPTPTTSSATGPLTSSSSPIWSTTSGTCSKSSAAWPTSRWHARASAQHVQPTLGPAAVGRLPPRHGRATLAAELAHPRRPRPTCSTSPASRCCATGRKSLAAPDTPSRRIGQPLSREAARPPPPGPDQLPDRPAASATAARRRLGFGHRSRRNEAGNVADIFARSARLPAEPN